MQSSFRQILSGRPRLNLRRVSRKSSWKSSSNTSLRPSTRRKGQLPVPFVYTFINAQVANQDLVVTLRFHTIQNDVENMNEAREEATIVMRPTPRVTRRKILQNPISPCSILKKTQPHHIRCDDEIEALSLDGNNFVTHRNETQSKFENEHLLTKSASIQTRASPPKLYSHRCLLIPRARKTNLIVQRSFIAVQKNVCRCLAGP